MKSNSQTSRNLKVPVIILQVEIAHPFPPSFIPLLLAQFREETDHDSSRELYTWCTYIS